MVNKQIIDLGKQYHDLQEDSDAFKHLFNEINDKISFHREILDEMDIRKGNPNSALYDISTIQALRWVIEVVDEAIEKGMNEAMKAAIQEDPPIIDPAMAIEEK